MSLGTCAAGPVSCGCLLPLSRAPLQQPLCHPKVPRCSVCRCAVKLMTHLLLLAL